MKTLIFVDYYLPGFKGGGPIRTIANLINKIGSEIQFSLVTSDRDLDDTRPYSDIEPNHWQQVGSAMIYYASPGIGWVLKLWGIILSFRGEAIHLNSFFSFRFSVLPLLYWRFLKRGKPVILGPRGELSEGALALKSPKKRFFIALTKAMGLYRGVIWHASTEHEASDIRRVIGDNAQVRIAIDIACPPPALTIQARQAGGALRMMFMSRISPMKNLLGAIQMLAQVHCPVVFDVYGPTEDTTYWENCLSAASELPSHIQFNYLGPLYPSQVPEKMAGYDIFYMPTLGENFGHVIAEALGCGLPVLIADTTPWRNLEQQGLGWDIPLFQPERFVAAIEICGGMQAKDYDAWRQRIRAWALANIGNGEAIEQSRQLFMNLDTSHEH